MRVTPDSPEPCPNCGRALDVMDVGTFGSPPDYISGMCDWDEGCGWPYHQEKAAGGTPFWRNPPADEDFVSGVDPIAAIRSWVAGIRA